MAKEGLSYYTSDTDRFSDVRIRRLKRAKGAIGYVCYEFTLNEIYRDKGYYVPKTEDLVLDIAEYWQIEESDVREILDLCVEIGLFSKEMCENKGILTSMSIQERYMKAMKSLKRDRFSNVEIDEQYNLLSDNVRTKRQNVQTLYGRCTDEIEKSTDDVRTDAVRNGDLTGQGTDETPICTDEIRLKDRIGYKKKKEKERIKEKDAANAATSIQEETSFEEVEDVDTTPQTIKPTMTPAEKRVQQQMAMKKREQAFYESLIPYVGQYGKEMVRAFFSYWSEPNKSGTKMRFELQVTFELSRRLATWARRNEINPQNNGTARITPQRNSKFTDPQRAAAAIAAGLNSANTELGNNTI